MWSVLDVILGIGFMVAGALASVAGGMAIATAYAVFASLTQDHPILKRRIW